MSTQRQMRGDTAANLAAVTPAEREHIYDITNKRIGAGDGNTLGNSLKLFALMQADLVTMAPISGVASGTGSPVDVNALEVTLDPAPESYTTFMTVLIKPAANNTGAVTIDVNGLGAKAIKKNVGDALVGDDLETGGMYALLYDGTNFQLLSGAGGSGDGPTMQVYTADDTWTKPAGLTAVEVIVVAGGGGGGASTATNNRIGAGGGAGGVSIERIPAASLSATEDLQVGAAGAGGAAGNNNGGAGETSRFGTVGPFLSASGGAGGGHGGTPTAGAAGVGSGGDINITGQDGSDGAAATDTRTFANAIGLIPHGRGGSSPLGFGFPSPSSPQNSAPAAATGYGAGGNGGWRDDSGAAGGDGAPGLVVVREYY